MFSSPCSIPTDPRVLVGGCSINQYFSKSKCAIILFSLGREDLKKWVEECFRVRNELSSAIQTYCFPFSPQYMQPRARKLGISPWPSFCYICKEKYEVVPFKSCLDSQNIHSLAFLSSPPLFFPGVIVFSNDN